MLEDLADISGRKIEEKVEEFIVDKKTARKVLIELKKATQEAINKLGEQNVRIICSECVCKCI